MTYNESQRADDVTMPFCEGNLMFYSFNLTNEIFCLLAIISNNGIQWAIMITNTMKKY